VSRDLSSKPDPRGPGPEAFGPIRSCRRVAPLTDREREKEREISERERERLCLGEREKDERERAAASRGALVNQGCRELRAAACFVVNRY
jgi:hypothetical protein